MAASTIGLCGWGTVTLRSRDGLVPDGFAGHYVTAVERMCQNQVRPHQTDMWILNDARVADYPRADIDAELARDGIIMTRYLARTPERTRQFLGKPLPKNLDRSPNGVLAGIQK